MHNSRLNNSIISNRTRSRSNSASSMDFSINGEVSQSSSVTPPTPPVGSVNPTSITASLSKSLQVVGAISTWDNIKADIKKLSAAVAVNQERLLQYEENQQRMESKLDLVLNLLRSSSQHPVSSQRNTSFAPNGSHFNDLSVSRYLE